jgi:hypothetical protein
MNVTDQPVPRVYVVLGMQRSGHHLVINQICFQIGRVLHLNNCVLTQPTGLRPVAGRYRTYDAGETFDSGLLDRAEYQRQIKRLGGRYDQVVCSFENAKLGRPYVRHVLAYGQPVTLCIVRDPFNWIASMMKFGGEMARDLPRRILLWKAQVEQCLHPETYSDGAFIGVNYDRWVTDPQYARSVCEEMGLSYTDAGRDEVIDFAAGSSFDGVAFHGKASAMQVMERWCVYKEDPRYRAYFENDPDLARLSEQYFAFSPFS